MSDLRGLKRVRVERKKVLETLKENRESHLQEYNDAITGWREQIQQMVDSLNGDTEGLSDDELQSRVLEIKDEVYDRPQSHVDQYDQYIEMLETSLDDELELTQEQFAKFMRDDWSWKSQFRASSAKYSS